MVGIASGGVTRQLAVNARPARPRVIQRLKYEDARALPMMNPSRCRSKGRLARSGSALRVLIAFIAQKLA